MAWMRLIQRMLLSICCLPWIAGLVSFPLYSQAADETVIRLCVDPDWYPFEAISSDGKHIGIAANLWSLIAQRSHLKIELVKTANWAASLSAAKSGQCDALSLLNETHERSQWLDFTSPYLIDPNAWIVRVEDEELKANQIIQSKKIVLPEGTGVEERLRQDYPNIQIMHSSSEEEAFRWVESGRADATLRSRLMAQYTITHDGWFNLRIADEMPGFENFLRIGVVKTQMALRDRLEKGVESLTMDEIHQEVNRYIPIIVHKTDYRMVSGVAAFSLLLISLILLWVRQLGKLNKALAISQAELHQELVKRVEYQNLLDRTNERYRILIETAQEGIMVIQNKKIVFNNPAMARLLGYSTELFRQMTLEEFIAPEDLDIASQHHYQCLLGAHDEQRYTVRLQHYAGHFLICEMSTALIDWEDGRAVLNFVNDVTEKYKNDQEIQFIAQHDILTGLPNRLLLEDRLSQAIAVAERRQERLAVLFVDLDKFKPVNDLYGHEMGDWLLHQVAERLKKSVRESDTVARWGGDEFVILLPGIQNEEQIFNVSHKILNQLNQIFKTTTGIELAISCSIGIAVYPDHGMTVAELLNISDKGMYQAKRNKGNGIHLLFPLSENREIYSLRLNWKSELESGHSGIDKEHKEIFLLANQLLKGLSRKLNWIDTRQELIELVDHLSTHFKHEEAVLKAIQFPLYEPHSQEHMREQRYQYK